MSAPLIFLLKAEQLGLFEKLVPVKATVTQDGTVRAAHVAIRHVRPKAPKAPKRPLNDLQADLFGGSALKPPASSKPKTKEPAPLPLFDTPARSAGEERLARLRQRRDPEGQGDPLMDAVDRRVDAMAVVGGLDYAKPFDAIEVPRFGVVAGVSKEARRRINAEAAGLVESKSDFSTADRDLLKQYSGNGGCGDSLNEFYTDPHVAAAMWKVLADLGVAASGATVLEPSCATGVFIATAPQGVRVTGVELDPTSAQIATALHPSHEIQNDALERFATTDTRQFDAVIGNAPFGLRGGLLKADKKDLKTAEAYFMDTALDKTRAGGVVAMIVPTGLMDSRRDRKVRERLLRKAEFLGAMRMPNTAFEHSHTGVTSDVVFFRKRPDEVASALMSVDVNVLRKVGVWDDEYLAGSYFADRGADNVLGTMTEGWRAKAGLGDDITVEGSMVGVPEAIAGFAPEAPAAKPLSVADVLEACGDEAARERVRGASLKKPYDTARRGDRKTVDGVGYILEGEPLRWHRIDEFAASQEVIAASELGADIERAIGGADVPDLAERVKAYIEAHGNPAKNANLHVAAATDKAIYRLIGAVRADGSLSDVVSGRKAAVVENSFDAAAQALALEVGYFSPAMVAGRWSGGDQETALDHLYASPDYALDPTSGTWTTVDNYLSGEMWPKFDEAAEALAGELSGADRGKLQRQLKLLEEAIDPKSLEDVEVSLNSAFLPLHVVAGFFNDRSHGPDGNEWTRKQPEMVITFDKGVYQVRGGTHDAHLLGKYLNREGIRKETDLPTIERWNRDFKEWICASRFRDEVEELYNRSFRGFRQRAYSDAPIDVPGLAGEDLNAYHWSGLRWALDAGKGIIAADVGVGKTARGLILGALLKSTGQARRPAFIVPKSVAVNWVAEANRWFPGASIMVIGETVSQAADGTYKGTQDSPAERNRKFHDIRQNDYDFILITQPAWNDIDLDPETKAKYLDDDFWVQRGDSLGNAGDKRTKQIRERYEQSVAGRDFERRTDALYFNELGIDAIIGDEFHAYKNLYAAKNRFGEAPKFLGGQGLSNRALDTNLKARWVREQAGGRNVFGLTATPTKNSPLEIYSMLSHIAPEAFERIGIRNSEEFLDRFCVFETRNILNTQGKIEQALCVTGFKNLGELREIMRRYIDRTTAEDVGLRLPARDDRQHLVEMSAEQKAVYADLRELAAKSKDKDAEGSAHIFSIMDKMGKAAIDLELFDPKYAGAVSPKYQAAAAQIAAGAAEGGQVIFCDHNDSHEKIAAALVAAGMKRSEIGIINAKVAASSSKRQNISDAFNAGKLKAVIGNTATMGEGVNLQKGTTDIHHLNLPWEPASMQQRNGRGLRQGNISEAVRIHTYLSKGSFDGYRYQTVAAKKDWQDLLWNGGDRIDNLALEGSLSREDMMVMLADDPDAARAELDKNKALAQAKFEAAKSAEAVDAFNSFRAMKRSYAKLKEAERQKPSGERLRVKMERARVALEGNPHFKAKGALDAADDVLLHPQTGEAFEPGKAFEVDGHEGALRGGGKFVVVKAHPSHGLVQFRPYGDPKATTLSVELGSLQHGVRPVEYDAAAERAEISAKLADAAASKMNALEKMEDIKGLPSSVIEANEASIQQQLRSALGAHKWGTNGKIGFVSPDGAPKAVTYYNVRDVPADHKLLLPTDAHRKVVEEAWMADEKAKTMTQEAVTGRRGASTGEYRPTVKYPGDQAYYGEPTNRWTAVGKELFGDDFGKDLKERYDREALESARRAPTFAEAMKHALGTTTQQWGAGNWSRKALATLWAKAKASGVLATPMRDALVSRNEHGREGMHLPGAHLRAEPYHGAGRQESIAHLPVADGLRRLAASKGHYDLHTAMILQSDLHPENAAREILRQPQGAHVAEGLRHLIAKHPELADREASTLASGRYAGRTLGDVVEDHDGDARNAA